MSAPSVTYSFTNGTTSDATQVNTNFTDLINGASDGTRDYTIGTLVVNGATTLKGTVNLGDSTADDISVVGSIAATIPFKTNATYNIGAATLAPLSIYLGNGTKSTRLLAGTVGTSWTFTLPNDVPTITGQTMIFDTNGTASFRYSDKFTASKTTDYTATGDETVIPCAPAASMTVALPAASTMTGKSLTIVKTDSDISKTVTINPDGAETINGSATYVLYTQYESVTIKCNGTSWFVTDHFCSTPWVDAGAITITGTSSNPTKSSTVVTDKLFWRRVGDSVELRYFYAQSSNASAAAGSGDYLFAIPSNMTIDTGKVTVYATVEGWSSATAEWYAVGSGFFCDRDGAQGHVVACVYDTTKVRLQGTDTSGGGGVIGSAGYALSQAGGMCYSFTAMVPISGWNP